MKFKIEIEATSPTEKALARILRIDISSPNASPESIATILREAYLLIWGLGDSIKKMKAK